MGDDLLDRISQLEHIVLVDEAQKAAAACLGDNLVGSDSAQKCLDALAAIVNPLTR